MSAKLDCPGIECWQAVLDDTIPPDERERYECHLESCPACQEQLHRAGEGGDALRMLGREVGDPTVAPPDPTLVQFLERLHEGKLPVRTAPPGPPDLYFLRPADRPGVLGTLGAYEVQEVIGQGGMGVVLKAFDPALHRLVAVKVLAPALAGSATARRRFTREAQAAAAVCHDHVVAVHGVSEADGLPYLVMQYVAGESLQARLDRCGPLPVEEAVRIGLQAASGLAAAHAQGLIHRDVKPANLLLEGGLARVKVTDFGLARMAADVGFTQAGVVAGTPEYMAPEQARGEQVDYRSDLFSLGGVLYACCTGLPPFRGPTALAVLHCVNDQEPTPVRSLNPEVPAWLEALIVRLLAKDPADRFQSAAEVAALLEGYLAGLRQPDMVPAPVVPPAPAADGAGPPKPGMQARPINRLVQRFWPPALVLSAALGLGMAFWFAGPADEPPAKAAPFQEYFQPFKGKPDDLKAFELRGPDAEERVTNEPDGLRITLPPRSPDIFVALPSTVKGDFEISAGFEILKEPDPAHVGKYGTRVTLGVLLDTPEWNEGSVSRRMDPEGVTQFFTFLSIPQEAFRKDQAQMDYFPTEAKTGRLRLVRTGSVLACSACEGRGDFTLLKAYPFSGFDLKQVHMITSTGGSKAALDVRLTDLRIRAESLPNLAGAPSGKEGESGWLMAGIILGLLMAASSVLGTWLFVRQRRRAGGRSAGPLKGAGGTSP